MVSKLSGPLILHVANINIKASNMMQQTHNIVFGELTHYGFELFNNSSNLLLKHLFTIQNVMPHCISSVCPPQKQ